MLKLCSPYSQLCCSPPLLVLWLFWSHWGSWGDLSLVDGLMHISSPTSCRWLLIFHSYFLGRVTGCINIFSKLKPITSLNNSDCVNYKNNFFTIYLETSFLCLGFPCIDGGSNNLKLSSVNVMLSTLGNGQ